MKTFSDWYNEMDLENNSMLFEMTGIAPKHSGLNHFIWISSKGNTKHGIRIKVSNVPGQFSSNDNFSLSVHPNNPQVVSGTCKLKTKDLNKVRQWVIVNHDALQRIWNDRTLDSLDHFSLIKRI